MENIKFLEIVEKNIKKTSRTRELIKRVIRVFERKNIGLDPDSFVLDKVINKKGVLQKRLTFDYVDGRTDFEKCFDSLDYDCFGANFENCEIEQDSNKIYILFK